MRYFLAPRSGEKSYKNFLSTIKHGVPFARIEPYLTNEGKIRVLQQDVIYAWGNREGTSSQWTRMEPGDTVIFYAHRKLVMAGEVYYKQHSPQLALAMWPRDEHGNPWEYTFFLKDLRYFSIPMPAFNRIVGYKPNFIVQGFTELTADRVKLLAIQYGSVEAFLNDFEDSESPEIPFSNEPVYVNLGDHIEPEIILNPQIVLPEKEIPVPKSTKPFKLDYEKRSRDNAITGSKGEALTVLQEMRRLISHGREDLAKKVERVSLVDDSAGFDVLSFEDTGRERYIEVKTTTKGSERIRFYLSSREYEASQKLNNYNLYFIDRINKPRPRITMFNEPFQKNKFILSPDSYVAEGMRV